MVKLDLKDAYLTVPIHSEHKWFLRFTCQGKHFQFRTLPFGLNEKILNPCLTPAPLSVEKPDFPDFLLHFLSFFFNLSSSSQAISVLPEPLELVSAQFFSAWVEDVQRQGQKKKEDIFCL